MVKLKAVIKGLLCNLFCKVFPEIKLIYTYKNSTELLQSSFADLKDENHLIKKDVEEVMSYIDLQDPSFLKRFDEKNLPSIFQARLGYDLKLDNPKTFNEKLQWLKINVRKPEMTIMADKYRVREYLKQRGFGKYLNQLYGVYSNIEEVKKDWGNLPDKFVLKANHWSGGNVFVKNKCDFNFEELDVLEILLQQNYYYKFRCGEWPYKDIQPYIVAEEFLEDETGGLIDYKVFCFNGRAHFVQVDIDRFTNHTRCFYDLNWVKQPFVTFYPLYSGVINKPSNLNEMLGFAEALSQRHPLLRVDLYKIGRKIFFGECTFTHGSGFERFQPEEWDRKLGEFIDIDFCRP